jgi:hypothetical protein
LRTILLGIARCRDTSKQVDVIAHLDLPRVDLPATGRPVQRCRAASMIAAL